MKKKTAKNNSRKITVPLPQDRLEKVGLEHHFLRIGLIFLSIMLVAFSLLAVYLYIHYFNVKNKWLAARDNFSYWQEVAKLQDNSPDAYYQAAVYALQINDKQKALEDLNRAVDLDPGFEKAIKLRDSMLGK